MVGVCSCQKIAGCKGESVIDESDIPSREVFSYLCIDLQPRCRRNSDDWRSVTEDLLQLGFVFFGVRKNPQRRLWVITNKTIDPPLQKSLGPDLIKIRS